MSYRQQYDDQLQLIRSNVVRMGNLATEMVRLAVDSALAGDLELASKVIAMDDEVDRLESESLHRCVLTVVREAPVASDLRLLVSTIGVLGEIEKVADDAVKLARRATKLTGQFPGELKSALAELGTHANQSFASSLRLYAEYDAGLAREVIDADKAIDSEYKGARNRVFEMIKANPNATESLVRTIEVFHALEHVADHAVEIASRLQMHHNMSAINEVANESPARPPGTAAEGESTPE
ncbi:MAG: phosphate signaling complex protein PhoU [Fimbriimonadaceae bacterium]|nr:phosphate signaling complex protein PhoU [Chthonomonadaceae bacterium]MCO5295629.1 phosphate signaling complex protein PhoU [Fimbriimonadaceae bacterium]